MDLPDLDTLFTNYQTEIVQDIQVDELSLKDKAMMVPTIKHKWVARMMQHKAQLRRFQSIKKEKIKSAANASPISMSKTALDQLTQNNPEITQLQEFIDKLEGIIEYLEKVEKLTSSLTYDCKNVIDLQKLETT
jgi:Asp-tRNA(Asn)/Glu-tRNA(Gln) amidotransferase C subunit